MTISHSLAMVLALGGTALALPATASATTGAGSPAVPVADSAATQEAAYRALADQAEARINDARFNYDLGVAAVDAGHIPEAIVAFQRVLALDPGHAQARAEIARAYALVGDVDTAREQFDTVLRDPSLPDPVRQRFTQLVRGLDRQISGKHREVTGFVDLSSGFDSNINSATGLSTITIPLFAVFGPGSLGTNARAIGEAYGEAQGGVSVVEGVGRDSRVFASLLGDYRGNAETRAFNQASVTTTLGYAKTLGRHDTLSFSAQGQQFWLGDANYRQTWGAIGQYTRPLANGAALSVSAQYAYYHYANQPLYNVHHMALGASLATRRYVLASDVGYEASDSASTQSNYFSDLSLSGELPLGPRLAVQAALAMGGKLYDKPDALFLAKRRDLRIDASIGLRLMLSEHLSLRPRVTYTRAFSNIPLYDTERWTLGAAVRAEF